MAARPRLVLSGVASGVGKTSLSLGIARALVRRGVRVQTFKVGPDFLDPGYLAMASDRTCYNLDGWMTGREYVQNLFSRATADADIAIIEGVMGLFDGASATGLEGSTAEIAAWLDAPVVLAVNVHGMARSVAAVVKGYAQLEPSVKLSGVIANHAGGMSHRLTLAQSLAGADLPPLVGAVPRDALPSLPSRHLGLVTATEASLPEKTIEKLADACEQYLDLDQISAMAKEAPEIELPDAPTDSVPAINAKPVRLGLARDEAFHFYYPDNLEMLRDLGAELVEFSPLHDRRLPENLGGIFLGGGYPELHAEQLSANRAMIEDIRRFAAAGKCIYAECGGLMYLGRRLITLEDKQVSMAGVLPVETAMLKDLKALGYVQAQPAAESFWRGNGQVQNLRGHEFHYSEITATPSPADGWRAAYTAVRRRTGAAPEGFCKGAIVASYIHLHFGSCPAAARRLVQCCEEHQ